MTKNPSMPRTKQSKWLGVGASCTVWLHFLRPKNKVKEVILNQTGRQETEWVDCPIKGGEIHLSGGHGVHRILTHDFGGQLLWALERGVIVDTEGPEELMFNQPPPAAASAAAPPVAATDQV